jgi:hypothetical protein
VEGKRGWWRGSAWSERDELSRALDWGGNTDIIYRMDIEERLKLPILARWELAVRGVHDELSGLRIFSSKR